MPGPEFDPSKPYETEGGPEFNPSAPYEPEGPAVRPKMRRREAALHGVVEATPFAQKATAAGAAGTLTLLKALGSLGIGPEYWQNIKGNSYKDQLGQERGAFEKAEKDYPAEHWYSPTPTHLGQLVGGGLSMAALSPGKAAQGLGWLGRTGVAAANAGLYGGAHGFGRGDTLGESLTNAAIEAPTTAILGGLAHLGLAEAAPVASRYAGGGLQDLAGWLKVNSLHPTPTLGEAMEGIPGGVSAVGRELLDRNIGGLTKASTAKQIETAFEGATGKASELAKAHDATGAPLDLGEALAAAQAKAEALTAEPATREAGIKLQSLVADYAEKYGSGEAAPASAQEALATKRALGPVGYGARQEFKLTGNPVAGDYGAGVRQLERGMDSALDDTLGPEFEQANTLVRRLGGAKQAAERGAARTAGNHLIGLLPYLGGLAGLGSHASGHGGSAALAFGLASLLSSKYGSQVGARTLYGIGAGLKLTPEVMGLLARKAPAAVNAAATSPATFGVPALRLAGMAPRSQPMFPAYAMGDE